MEIEFARAIFIVGMVVAAFTYERWRILTGGTITGSYIAFLIAFGHWEDLVLWIILSAIGVATIRAVTNRYPLPRNWVFYAGVLVPALVHATLVEFGTSLNSDLTPFLIAGLYVTNGMTAYDVVRQGFLKTALVLLAVVTLTLAVILPLRISLVGWGVPEHFSLFTPVEPITIIVCIVAASVMRLVLGWGTAGIIGVVFLFQIVNLESLLPILAFTVTGTFVYRLARRFVTLTPRQEIQVIMVVGGIVGWFGLFWAQYFGISGAAIPDSYALEPLIVIGLMVLEGVRMGLPKALGGTAIVLAIVAASAWLCSLPSQWFLLGHAAIGGVLAITLAIGWRRVQRGVLAAVTAGREHPIRRYNQREA